jgi:hypothetical protein
MSGPSSPGCRHPARGFLPLLRALAAAPAPALPLASGGSRTSTVENPPRRSAPAPASPPSAPLGPVPSECPTAAFFHQPSVCTAATPLAVGTRLLAARFGALPGIAPLQASRSRRASVGPRPPRLDCASPASTLPVGRHSYRCGHTTRESGVLGSAWPQPTAVFGVVALCPQAPACVGVWTGSPVRPCPRAYLLRRPDHRRGPSLLPCSAPRLSSVLRPPRTPAAHRSTSPSAYTSRLAATTAVQTGLSCSALLLPIVPLPVPRRNPQHPPVSVLWMLPSP